jgi:uncharacterized membrane protein
MLPIPSFSIEHLHPILVNFTAGLVPASVASDVIGRVTGKLSFRHAAWWMLCYAAAITPLTAAAGFVWKKSVEAVTPPEVLRVHQWVGVALALLFIVMAVWRGAKHLRNEPPGDSYFVVAFAVLAVLMYQGSMGGTLAFGP